MPPYTPVTSKAQSRALFAKANRGELSMEDAKGKTAAADFSHLPERKTSKPPARKKMASRPAGRMSSRCR